MREGVSIFCPRCGRQSRGASFWPACGAALPAEALTIRAPGAYAVLAILITMAVTLVLVLLAGILVVRRENARPPAADAAESASTPATQLAMVIVTASPAPAAAPGDVRDQPDGLFCRDLDARGFSYVAAVDYWRMHGQPDRMDADLNGIPCETIYPAGDVAAYWYR